MQRAGGDGRQVRLEEDVVDGLGQEGGEEGGGAGRGGAGVRGGGRRGGLGGGVDQRAAVGGERAAAGHAEQLGLGQGPLGEA